MKLIFKLQIQNYWFYFRTKTMIKEIKRLSNDIRSANRKKVKSLLRIKKEYMTSLSGRITKKL